MDQRTAGGNSGRTRGFILRGLLELRQARKVRWVWFSSIQARMPDAPRRRCPAPRAPVDSVRSLLADDNADGQRLDNFLFRQPKGVPKTHVYRIIRSGEVPVNKGRAQADTRVAAGWGFGGPIAGSQWLIS
jgi:hypothetical protein